MRCPIQIRQWSRNSILRNILFLFSGTGLAQLIPIGAQFFLARLYTEAEFGELGVYISIISMLGGIATLNYDYVIIILRKQSEARSMLILSVLASIAMGALSLIGLYVLEPILCEVLDMTEYSLVIWFAPPSVTCLGLINAFGNWYNRRRAYKKMVVGQLSQNIFISLFKLLFGFMGIAGGLIAGTIAGYIIAVLYFIYIYATEHNRLSSLLCTFSKKRIKRLAYEYRDFSVYSTIGSIFNTFVLMGLPLLISFFYPLEIAGLYFFANSIARMPINLLSVSIGKVYKKEASEIWQRHPQDLYRFTVRIQKIILGFVFPLLLFLSLFGSWLFSFLFGETWADSGDMVRYFALFVLFNALYSPVSSIADILRRQKALLIFNISLAASQVLIFIVGAGSEFKYILLGTSIVGAMHYIVLDTYMKHCIKKI